MAEMAKPDTSAPSDQATSSGAAGEPSAPGVEVMLSPTNVWRIGMTLIGVAAVGLFLIFLIDDGGSVIFTVLMSWFAAIAMAPAVDRLAKHMRRGLATITVMVGLMVFIALFLFAFGSLLVEQLVGVISSVPQISQDLIAWANQQFGMNLTQKDILDSLGLTDEKLVEIAREVSGNVLGLLGSFLGSVFSIFTFALFTFYLSADGPRFKIWLAQLFPDRVQTVFVNVWDITAEKTGGYVAARVILATLNAATTGVVFYFIGMPYWLALAIWTGLIAQFVPTIGTYISIILPVIVGLLSPDPKVGVIALIWALIYQQVENMTFEPKISAKAVDVHPAVAFGAVMLGASLFGVSGALLAVPVGAMLLALLGIYHKRNALTPELKAEVPELSTAQEKKRKKQSGKTGAEASAVAGASPPGPDTRATSTESS